MDCGGLVGVVFNVVKEVVLDGFIDGVIGFFDMSWVVECVLNIMLDSGLDVLIFDDILVVDIEVCICVV